MFRRKFKISFNVHKFYFLMMLVMITILLSFMAWRVKTMVFQTWGSFIRVLHVIAMYCVVFHVIRLHWYYRSDHGWLAWQWCYMLVIMVTSMSATMSATLSTSMSVIFLHVGHLFHPHVGHHVGHLGTSKRPRKCKYCVLEFRHM